MMKGCRIMRNTFTKNTDINRNLLQPILGKDTDAFKYLYKETSPSVFSLILYFVKKRDLADHVLEQTYLQIWGDTSNSSLAQGKVIDYMLILAKNNAIEALRNTLRS